MKKYNLYSDSGVKWIGEIPEHWEVKKITYCFQKIGSGTTPTSGQQEYYENGAYNWLQTGDLNDGEITETSKRITELALKDYTTLRFYPINSIVIAMYGATIGKMGILKTETTTNQACCVLSNPQGVEVKFVFYWFLSSKDHIISLSYGGGQPNINQDIIRNLRLQIPTLPEQQQIVEFLDQKTSVIDSLIQKKQRKIELLKEHRGTIINHTVTKGLDPNVKMKDSGVEWFSEIPENWGFVRIGFISNLLTGNPWASELFDLEDGIKIVRGDNVSEGFLRWGEKTRYWKHEIIKDKAYFLEDGDVIISMDGSKVGKNFVLISSNDLPLLLHQRMCRVRVKLSTLPKFLTYIVGSLMFRYYIDISKTDSMIPHITQKDISDFYFPLPSVYEQQQIVEYLDQKTTEIDTQINLENRKIDLLKEFRQSLISEVVTGKIDVRKN